MKQTKEGQLTKKLELNKQTIDNLTREELADIKAGKHSPCWENLWTLYHCDVMYTGEPETQAVVENAAAAPYEYL